jgi:hypothetical protein
LKKQNSALRGASPDELATFSLAILHVDVPARILQTAILELTIHVDAIVQNHVLTLKHLVFVSIHRVTHRFTWPHAGTKFSISPGATIAIRGTRAGLTRWEPSVEATIRVAGMQAS